MPKDKKNDEVVINLDQFVVPGAIILAGVIIAVAIFFSDKKEDKVDNTSPDNVAGQDDSEYDFADSSTDIGNAPYIGNKDTAKIAIVEYSDYRCGFCQRHTLETLPLLIENYVDTGDIIYVFRDFPIYGDDISNGAKCVFNIEGLDAYKEFHTNAYNLEGDDAIIDLAVEVGVNEGDFTKCFNDSKYADDIEADKNAGIKAGVQGTPGFIVGTLDDDGNVTGKFIAGAYPYDAFVEVIDSLLQ